MRNRRARRARYPLHIIAPLQMLILAAVISLFFHFAIGAARPIRDVAGSTATSGEWLQYYLRPLPGPFV